MRLSPVQLRMRRVTTLGLTFLIALAFAAPTFAESEDATERPANFLAEEEEAEKLEFEIEDGNVLDRRAGEFSARVRSTRLLAHVCTKSDRRHLRRMIPRAPPRA